jgi:thymidylate synthase (FAD)
MKVTYENHMGTDLSVVNAAKVSFGKRSVFEGRVGGPDVLSKQDQSLIAFLARGCTSDDWDDHRQWVAEASDEGDWEAFEDLLNHIRKMPSHWSPFAHTAVTLHLKMPIFVARQIMSQTKDIDFTEMDFEGEPEFYVPDVWRKKSEDVKQGSSDEAVEMLCLGPDGNQERALPTLSHSCGKVRQSVGVAYAGCLGLYKEMLESGVAPEQARMVLPQSMCTEVIATGNLFAWANLYIQRSDGHTQKETQDLAKQIGEIIQPLYPVSWAALVD